MPHVIIKHFDTSLTPAHKERIAATITEVLTDIFGCLPQAVSIALHPIAASDWMETVFVPDIQQSTTEIIQMPNYDALASATKNNEDSTHV